MILIGLVGLGFLITFFRINPDPNFWFVPDLPVPPYAHNIQRSDMPLNNGSLGGYRILTFETDQPVDAIQRFYRTELSKRGWSFMCSPTHLEDPGCPLGLSPSVALAEAYTRNDEPSKMRAVNLEIYQPGRYLASIADTVVEVIEYRYPLSYP